MQGQRQERAAAERAALELLAEYRKNGSLSSEEDRLALMLSAARGRGGATQSNNIRGEILYLLEAQDDLPLKNICKIMGLSTNMLMKLRQKDPEVDQAVKNYQASYFEDEAMTGEKGLHPALTIFGLKARAGWMDAKDRAISQEQFAAMTERFIDVLRRHVKDPVLLDAIVKDLMGEPVTTQVVVTDA